ncbi:MAG: hypothetical protein NUV34_10310 [Sulfuricaulis sp.]|nr:hypothetical protein [Sulfuricaulis sp.]
MELALLRVAGQAGKGHETLLSEYEKVDEHAFDQDTKMMASVHRDGDGFLYAIKGAPEAVIDVCTRVLGPDGIQDMDATTRTDWLDRSGAAAGEGLRLLAMAMKQTDRDD